MAYYLLCTYYDTGEVFDVSELAHDIEFTTSLNSQPGKFTFYLEKDPNSLLKINIGSIIQFFSDAKTIFYGKVFTIETDSTDVIKVTSYDMMRYLKNEDSKIIDGTEPNLNLRTFFMKLMKQYNINYHVAPWYTQLTLLPLEEHNFQNQSLFDILDYCMVEEELRQGLDASTKSKLMTSKNNNLYRRFYLKCNGDVIELREIYYDFFYDEYGKVKNNFLMIGDESLLSNYRYKVDIDSDTYNRFIFVANEESEDASSSEDTNTQVKQQRLVASMDAGYRISNTDTKLDGKKIGENTLSKWGILSKIVELKTIEKSNEVADYMKTVIEVFSQPSRTLKLNAIGYDGVVAGSAFFLHLSKLGIHYPVYVLSATHRYDSDEHMMELEVATNVNMRNFL